MTQQTKPENPPASPGHVLISPMGDFRISSSMQEWSLTLRDYFAGQALMSMLSTPSVINDSAYPKAAELSYKFADAMLQARGENHD